MFQHRPAVQWCILTSKVRQEGCSPSPSSSPSIFEAFEEALTDLNLQVRSRSSEFQGHIRAIGHTQRLTWSHILELSLKRGEVVMKIYDFSPSFAECIGPPYLCPEVCIRKSCSS